MFSSGTAAVGSDRTVTIGVGMRGVETGSSRGACSEGSGFGRWVA